MAKTIVRRTPEEIVAEYEAKIAAVKARAAAKQAKASPVTDRGIRATRSSAKRSHLPRGVTSG